MLKFMRILLKIILAPFILIYSFVLWAVTQIVGLVAGFAMMLSVVFLIFGVWFIFDPAYNWAITPAFITAFIFSPFGLPLVAGIVIVKAEDFRDWLKAI